jgi:putative flavoprotein involved in K+ transport
MILADAHRRTLLADANATRPKRAPKRRPRERSETVIIGGGQAGLVMSYLLAQHGREHVVLEPTGPAHAWRRRWDSFALNGRSGRALNLPGLPYRGTDPEGYASRDEIVAYFDAYVALVRPPLRLGVCATAVRPAGRGRFVVETDAGALLADHVVIATGRHQTPDVPPLAGAIPRDIVQLHTHDYRCPAQLPAGNVLVVGAGQSSCQIVEELHAAGHRVYLSVGRCRRAPIRYRGRELTEWAAALGEPWSDLAFGAQFTGRDGGRALNLHAFARDGMALLGKLAGCDGRVLQFTPDLHERLREADSHDALARRLVDEFIAANGLDCPPEPPPPALRDGFDQPTRTAVDLDAEGITSVVWGTGYRFDLSWVRFPILDPAGEPLHELGATRVPGMHVLGFAVRRRPRSSLLPYVGAEAQAVAAAIAGRLGGARWRQPLPAPRPIQ